VEIPLSARTVAPGLLNFDPRAIQVSAHDGALRLMAQPSEVTIAITNLSAEKATAVIDQARAWNQEHGFFEEVVVAKKEKGSWWSNGVTAPLGRAWQEHVTKPLGDFLRRHFSREQKATTASAGNVGVVYFTLSKEPPAEKNTVVSFAKKPHGFEYLGFGAADFRVIQGERFVFHSGNWNTPFMAVVQLDPKRQTETAAVFKTRSGDIPLAWAITLWILGGMFLAFGIYHRFVLPRPAADRPVVSGQNILVDFFATLGSFFKKPGIGVALAFILFYRFAEAQSVTMLTPFLLDTREAGGLGLTTSQVGLVYGTIGIIALTIGGLIGAFLAAKHGLKKMLPVMVCTIHLPNLAFLYLSFVQPENFAAIGASIAIEQFGYGFGFSAYMLFLLYFADGPNKTSHYAICTGFMALGMMLPRMWSGWLQEIVGYKHFFVWVMIATIPGFLVAFLIKVDSQFGKKS
jgi:PAT family beta-lactamase induction signal transducer AmpG